MKIGTKYGFTLIELLIVVAIVAILAAIAIPTLSTYRTRGYNAAATSDISNIRLTEEGMYAEFMDFGGASVTAVTLTLIGATIGTSQTVVLSPGVSAGAKVFASGGKNSSYTGVAKHVNGDTAYGTEPESQGLYRYGMSSGINLQNSDIPSSTQGIDFVTPWAPIS